LTAKGVFSPHFGAYLHSDFNQNIYPKIKKLMQKPNALLLVASLFFTLGATLASPRGPLSDTILTSAETAFATGQLQRTAGLVRGSIEGLSPAQLSFKPAPNAWSINDVMEHIALAEQGLYFVVNQALQAPPNPAKRDSITVTANDVVKRLTNRNFKAQSPEMIKPSGKFPDARQAEAAFEKSRATTIGFLAQNNRNFKERYWYHPATGTIDLYLTIVLIAAHSERHFLQIEEVKQHPAFPKA